MAYNKNDIISKFEMALKESAIDCKLNYHGNVYNKNMLAITHHLRGPRGLWIV